MTAELRQAIDAVGHIKCDEVNASEIDLQLNDSVLTNKVEKRQVKDNAASYQAWGRFSDK